ncbi:hypothetical protein HNQ35_002806 [Cerasibacillus quisquiliarum]|nr:hypothetical protein [Cerasibacillus quisquiliarum]
MKKKIISSVAATLATTMLVSAVGVTDKLNGTVSAK